MTRPQTRKHPRAPFASLVHCMTPGGDRIVASGGNISCGGLFIPTVKELPAGEQVSLKFRLPYPGSTIESVAKVVWRRPADQQDGTPAGVGLEFVDLPGVFRDGIADYVNQASSLLEP
ncbi:MAG: PilZ domain-containing protein [Chrysiogenetes bacterium]|nr:PilZ domain-containing protein [Chrysiogenetes bacterium]